ncbi:MAG: hypothetical protein ACTIDY_12500 [Halomonadaceae bacterium]|uniref:Diguanylate cyclase n=1 Tax=Halomonas colorata TaxID=2742615 RepID=A0ABR9FXB4_9GAMM|nr:hypothetical protein [Halomonas colorata]MBE0463288.1 hypothetical protein [Halomonas colorata]
MQSKYKIRLLKASLFAAAAVLAIWTLTAPPMAALLLWLSVGWLSITALLLDFSHRYSHGLPWQVLPGALLLGLIAAAPERHSMLIWAWAAMFMLPQTRWILAFNVIAALFSWVLIAPQLSLPEGGLMLLLFILLSLLALSRARQLVDMNGAIRQRLRLIPKVNLWAGEQLLRDLPREQTRSEREAIHAELVVFQVKRHQLWSMAKKLCALTYTFENAYRLNGTTLATLMLSRSPQEAALRRKQLHAALPDSVLSHSLPLIDIEPANLTLEELSHPSCQRSPT